MSSGEIQVQVVYGSLHRPRSFGQLHEATDFLAERQDAGWSVAMPLEIELAGELIDVDGIESLKLDTGFKSGVVPRYKHKVHPSGVTVSTASFPDLTICAQVDDYYSSGLLDRGLAWVRVAPELRPPSLRFGIKKDHKHSSELIEQTARDAGQKALSLVMAVLNSEARPPFTRQD